MNGGFARKVPIDELVGEIYPASRKWMLLNMSVQPPHQSLLYVHHLPWLHTDEPWAATIFWDSRETRNRVRQILTKPIFPKIIGEVSCIDEEVFLIWVDLV
jgi:hypothetical protein